MAEKHKIVISGAGPAGVTTSLFLAQAGIPHLLLEKEKFPRDKVCGDALSGKVISVFNKLDPSICAGLKKEPLLLPSYGIRFVAPNGKNIDVGFPVKQSNDIPGYVSPRLDFDNLLFKMLDRNFAQVREQTQLTGCSQTGEGAILEVKQNGTENEILADLVIAADGPRSPIAKKFTNFTVEEDHYCAGVRAYYTGVEGLHPQNFIELHFLKSLLPGYFWIFPLPNGRANIGLGMLSSHVSRNKINLRQKLWDIIQNEPQIAERFFYAKQEGKTQGWGLPLGSKKRQLSGNNFLLTGDAASLIDPFTGEGIGNAMISGLVAARVVAAAVKADDFSANFLAQYDDAIYQKLWKELKISRKLQQLAQQQWLFNFTINKTANSKQLQEIFTTMFTDLDMRAQLKNPLFYARLLFSR